MYIKAVFPGQFIQGQGVLNELPELINIFGNKGLILASPTVINKILPNYSNNELLNKVRREVFQGECSENEINRIENIIKSEKINVIIGMGGGKTIDTAKIAADRTNITVIIVPTIASTDAPCSACAVEYTNEGVFQAVHYQKRNPCVVLVDMDIIKNAPTRFLVSGMGDALATWFEARSCKKTQSVNECGGLSTLAALNIAKLCFDTIINYGYAAKIANDLHIVTPALTYITEANILLSGIGFESGGLATAHSIHNGLTVLAETHGFYHGEKVAFGVLSGLHLNSASNEEIETVYSFCEQIGLPTTFKDIGIDNINHNDLLKIAEKAISPEQAIHHEAGIINKDNVANAMLMADALGRARKKM